MRTDVVARLRDDGYLDDLRVAANRAQRLADRGHGNASIRFDLTRRGVPAEAIEKALGAVEPEDVRAERVALTFGGGARAARALARKGFGSDAIEHAVATVANDR